MKFSCRACGHTSPIDLFSLGNQWVVDFFNPKDPKEGIQSPLTLVMCDVCRLVQLTEMVNQDTIYSTYWYRSGMNNTMRRILEGVVTDALERQPVNEDSLVIDIGSNDGTMLNFYPDSVKKIGFEPSHNVWLESVNTVNFHKSYNEYFSFKGHVADIITSCAMFYDLADPSAFLEDIKLSLKPDGLWIDQQNYLGLMKDNLTYDNISHEHLSYYCFTTFEELLKRHQLKIVEIEVNEVNGGSLRCYIRHANHPEKSTRIQENAMWQLKESEADLLQPRTFWKFFNEIRLAANDLYQFIRDEVNQGKIFYIYGASTRGAVILQFADLDNVLIKGASEKAEQKIGLVTRGTNIPILSEQEVRDVNPDYMLVLPYFYRKEFIEREAEYLAKGGALIFPLPKAELVTKSGVKPLRSSIAI